MHWQYTPYVLPLIVAAAVSAALALFVWRRRPTPGAALCVLLMLAVAEWQLGYALELGGTDLPSKLFWGKVAHLGVVIVPTAWLAFALQYTGWEKWLTRRNVAMLAIEPLATLLLVWTNEVHGLIYSNVRLGTSGPFSVLDLTYGVWFWVDVAYSYLLVLLSTLLLLQAFIRSPRPYRGQAGVLLIGAFAPWVAEMLLISGLSPFYPLDLMPFAFTLTGLAFAWGLFRFRLLDIVPATRNAVIEGMNDGVIVLDARNRIVDLNPAAGRIIGRPAGEAIGQPVAQVLPGHPDGSTELAQVLVEHYHDVTEAHAEIVLGESDAQCTYGLRISPLCDRRGRLTGRLVVLCDITERRRAEEALKRRATQLATLGEVGRQIASLLELDPLLDHIVNLIREAFDYRYVSILLVDPATGKLALRAGAGYELESMEELRLRVGKDGVCGWVAASGEPLLAGDVSQEPRYLGALADTRSELAVPIQVKGQVVGVLDVQSTELEGFDEDDLFTLRTLADQVVVALENTRLFEAEREQRELAEALEEAAAAVSSTLHLDQVLDRILEQVERVVAGDAFNIMLVEGSTAQTVRWRGYDRLGVALPTTVGPLLIADFPSLAKMAQTREPLVILDTAADPNWITLKDRGWLHSYVAAPIRVGGETVGFLNVNGIQPGQFGPADARRLQAFASHAATAIENAQLYRELLNHTEQLEQRVQERTTQLQAQYARLDAILRSTSDGIVVADAGDEIIQTNPVAQTWLTQALSPEDAARLREAVRDLTRQVEERPETVLELTGLDLELKAAPIAPPQPSPLAGGEREGQAATVVAVHDVSHLKALDRVKSRFVSNVSHELRTPVTTIKLYATLLQQTSPEEEKWGEYLDALAREADWQARLVEEILQISRIDAGRLEMKPRLISLNELTEAAVGSHQVLAQDHGLTLEHRPSPPASGGEGGGGLVVMADSERMMQVLSNLVGNAIHYTPEGGKVVVSTGTEEAEGRIWATVTVADTGLGIPEEELPHVFERFFRGEKPRLMQISGTGLGLAIAKEIVELHGGRVTVESEVGVGTIFTVWLPLADQVSRCTE